MRPRRLEEGDALVLRTLEIMEHFNPLMWVIENPATGLLKTRPFMERLPWVDVTDCKYGTPYRKQTRLWTNMHWRPSRGLCRSWCDAWEDGRHLRNAQGGPRLMGGQRERVRGQSRELLYSIPTARARRLRVRPRQSLRIGRASRTEARGISYMSYFLGLRNLTRNSTRATRKKKGHACFQFRTLRGHFFLSRHALRRRPISRPTWHTATARRLRLRTLGRTCS